MLLHTLKDNLGDPLDALNEDKHNLSQQQQYNLGHLNDGLARLELIMNKAMQSTPVKSIKELDSSGKDTAANILVEKAMHSLASSSSVHDSDLFFRN